MSDQDDPLLGAAKPMMPDHDFTNARRNPYAADFKTASAFTVSYPDGTVRTLARTPLPELDPDSLRGTVDDVLFYVYNPRRDLLMVRLIDTLADAITVRESGRDYLLLVSEDRDQVVGLLISNYLARLDYLRPLLPERDGPDSQRRLVERGLGPLRSLLPAA